MRSSLLVLLLTVAISCGPATAQQRSGLDLAAIDPAVRPQEDFWRFANGKWLADTPIPADRSGYTSFTAVYETTQQQLRAVIEDIRPPAHAAKGHAEARKLADLYGAFMDEPQVETAGLGPLRAELAGIRRLRDKSGLPALFAHLSPLGVHTPWELDIGADRRDAEHYIAYLWQGHLGLPDRDYYLKDDAHFQTIRAAYRAHIAKLLSLAGEPAAEAGADAILALETAMARRQWTRVDNRDALKTYNKQRVAALPALLGKSGWPSYLAAAGVGPETQSLIVGQPSYFAALDGIVRETPVAAWRAYLSFNLLSAYAGVLPKAFVDEGFAFQQHIRRGVPENQPRWKRAVALVDGSLGFALGRRYVERYFPPASKARADSLIANISAAYRESIAGLDWMGPQTRREALAKLAAIRPKIGYPDPQHWRDYTRLVIRRDDLVGNVMRARRFNERFWLAKLGHKVDRDEWFTTPQTVNAFYRPSRNEIVFPAAILQPPFFDAGADAAASYGAIGSIIGHEVSHAFDDQGSRFDGTGNLRNWWTDDDRNRFEEKTRGLVAQYDGFEALPGYKVNGQLTLGENVADNSGLAIALKAYRLALGSRPAPVLDGYSGEQRFFLSYAQIWREKVRDPARIERLKVDPHSPGQFRADGALRNQGPFDDAFAVKPGDGMYLPPERRISIW